MIRNLPAPMARAAVTNSICLSLRNSPRVSRAMPVQLGDADDRHQCARSSALSSIATSARISTSVGMHITTSIAG